MKKIQLMKGFVVRCVSGGQARVVPGCVLIVTRLSITSTDASHPGIRLIRTVYVPVVFISGVGQHV
jgi:hypothetical protein